MQGGRGKGSERMGRDGTLVLKKKKEKKKRIKDKCRGKEKRRGEGRRRGRVK